MNDVIICDTSCAIESTKPWDCTNCQGSSRKLTDSRLRFAEDLEILNPALPVAYSRRDGWAEVKNVQSSGTLSWAKFKKCLVQQFLETLGDEVDRILIFLDASQSIAPGPYDTRLQRLGELSWILAPHKSQPLVDLEESGLVQMWFWKKKCKNIVFYSVVCTRGGWELATNTIF